MDYEEITDNTYTIIKLVGVVIVLVVGLIIGTVLALWVAQSYIKSHTKPVQSQSITMDDSPLSVVQGFVGVLYEPADIQPALGYKVLTEPQNWTIR